ncbi:MAG: exo-alpha-sialidase [Rhodobacteraceae bacterium]|nr:exo-alpha-sialidase [Paracoccaceae bacterium]
MNRRIYPILGCLLLLLPVAIHSVDLLSVEPSAGFHIQETDAEASGAVFRQQLLDAAGQQSVHAATLANLPGGGIGAWWFGGSREGGKDVEIWFARYERSSGRFSPARSIMSRHQLASDLGRYIRKLGNPAAFLDRDGRLWLFFVSVSIGGWAGSAVNVMTSDDGGINWSPARRLVTSPFFNISTLVRTPPVLMRDGSLALPAYHEFLGKFAEIITLEADGSIRSKQRLTWGRDALQPALVPTARDQAHIFMRYAGPPPKRMLYASTEDGGRSFSKARKLDLPNWDNSVAAATLTGDPHVWLVYNSSEGSRETLSIAISDENPALSRHIHDFTESGSGGEFSYPAIVTDPQGFHHVAWTHERKNISHAVFNDAWLLQLLSEPAQ